MRCHGRTLLKWFLVLAVLLQIIPLLYKHKGWVAVNVRINPAPTRSSLLLGHIFPPKANSSVPYKPVQSESVHTGKKSLKDQFFRNPQISCLHKMCGKKNLFKQYNLSKPPTFQLKDDKNLYFWKINNMYCLKEGTQLKASGVKGRCICQAGWYGDSCSYPDTVKDANLPERFKANLTIRSSPRRIIYGVPFNVEFEMTEARLAELGDIVDVFLFVESNYSAHGDPKPLRLLEQLKSGWAQRLHEKIVYVYLDHFPKEAYKNGWLADDLPRDIMGSQGLRKQITGIMHDDLFILTDADELPIRDALLFLKLHDNIPEPFGFHLRRTTYGFYWLAGNGNWPIMAGCTIAMLGHVFEYKVSKVRNPDGHLPKLQSNLNAYLKMGAVVHSWKLGSSDTPVGWHCSWCFGLEEMKIKLVSAMNGDFPRWGDYPEKQNTTYIRMLVQKGMWFDEKSMMEKVDPSSHLYAPKYMIDHESKFRYLLENVYGSR